MNNPAIPVVFVHDNNQPYLRAAISSAERAGNFVVLLGSECNKDFCTNWYDAGKFADTGYSEFEKLYVHMSSNPFNFELFCFRRYFFLYEYMRMNDVDCAMMLDSDVLFYLNCSDEKFVNTMKGKYVSVSSQGLQSGPQFLFIRREALREFMDFCMDTYKNHLDDLKECYHENFVSPNVRGGISDMVLLYMWLKTLEPSRILDWLTQDDYLMDHNVDMSKFREHEEFRIDKLLGLKDIKYIDGVPYFYELNKKQWLRAYALHFQGGSKLYMCDYFYGRPYAVKLMHAFIWHMKNFVPSSIKKTFKKLLRC